MSSLINLFFSVASHLQRPLNPECERFIAAFAQAGFSQTPAVPVQNKQQTPQNCRDTSQYRVVYIFDALISDYLGLRLGFCVFFFPKSRIFSIARRGLTMRKMAPHLPAPAVVLILINPNCFLVKNSFFKQLVIFLTAFAFPLNN